MFKKRQEDIKGIYDRIVWMLDRQKRREKSKKREKM